MDGYRYIHEISTINSMSLLFTTCRIASLAADNSQTPSIRPIPCFGRAVLDVPGADVQSWSFSFWPTTSRNLPKKSCDDGQEQSAALAMTAMTRFICYPAWVHLAMERMEESTCFFCAYSALTVIASFCWKPSKLKLISCKGASTCVQASSL